MAYEPNACQLSATCGCGDSRAALRHPLGSFMTPSPRPDETKSNVAEYVDKRQLAWVLLTVLVVVGAAIGIGVALSGGGHSAGSQAMGAQAQDSQSSVTQFGLPHHGRQSRWQVPRRYDRRPVLHRPGAHGSGIAGCLRPIWRSPLGVALPSPGSFVTCPGA